MKIHDFFNRLNKQLLLYVRHLAWLSAIPEDKEAKTSKKSKQSRTRQQALQDSNPDDPRLELPALEEGVDYLVGLFFEWGVIKQTGMGVAPLDWVDLNSWQSAQNMRLCPWENLILIEMSRAYASQLSQSSHPNCPPPYLNRDKIDLAQSGKLLEEQLKAVAIRKKG